MVKVMQVRQHESQVRLKGKMWGKKDVGSKLNRSIGIGLEEPNQGRVLGI